MNNTLQIKRAGLQTKIDSIQGMQPAPKIILISIATFIATGGGLLSYWGASARPELVPDPALAATVIIVCLFLLLLPFVNTRRDLWSILSPEVMGGLGYLVWIGVGAVTNHLWPGLAVNPSLFRYLPAGIAAQTLAALAFFGGAVAARRLDLNSTGRETHSSRLALVLLFYTAFALYLSVLMPREDAAQLRAMLRAGEPVSRALSVGPTIVLQSLPMIIAARIYLRGARFVWIRYAVIAILGLSTVFLLVSGSRIYAMQVVLLFLVAHTIVHRQFDKGLVRIVIGISVIVLVAATLMRLPRNVPVEMNPGVMSFEEVFERVGLIWSGASWAGFQEAMPNLQENIAYHLSDNQTMAMMIKNYDKGLLYGQASYNSLLSGLPRGLRPAGYQSGIVTITRHFGFYKEQATDITARPDWQTTIGVLGFADFGLFGLIAYPFVAGLVVRWIYNRTVLTAGLGQAGWLLYIPVVHVLWNPLEYGPDSIQRLRLLIFLALALRWATREKSVERESTGLPVVPTRSFDRSPRA